MLSATDVQNEPRPEKPCGIPTRSDKNRAVRPLLEISDLESKGSIYIYHVCGENKGADQLRGYRAPDMRLCFCISMQKAGFLMTRLE